MWYFIQLFYYTILKKTSKNMTKYLVVNYQIWYNFDSRINSGRVEDAYE